MEENLLVVKLKKPLTYEDRTYNEIKIDLDNITGEIMERAEKVLIQEKTFVVSSTTSATFAARVASLAGGYPVGLMGKLPAYAYVALTNGIINFLLTSNEDEFENK